MRPRIRCGRRARWFCPEMPRRTWRILFQPRRAAGLDQLVEKITVALGVHAGPKTVVFENVQLAVARKFYQRLSLQDTILILGKAGQEIAMEEEKTAVDPVVFEVGLLGKFDDLIVPDLDF